MKWLIIILVILLFVVISMALRYRRQLQMGWQMWKMFRMMRKAGKPPETKEKKQESLKDVQLVRCEKCGKWISPESALKLRQEKYYCSSTCMEKAARLQSLVD
ncbi:MAG TPA: hypothetical protein PKY82_20275 [Pyrinomonadaceae bacterium]|nr:hypothetical protein [Pyrinomonadaceae bacterium]